MNGQLTYWYIIRGIGISTLKIIFGLIKACRPQNEGDRGGLVWSSKSSAR